MKHIKVIALIFIIFSATIHCLPFGSKKELAAHYAMMYRIDDKEQIKFLEAIADNKKEKINGFLNDGYFLDRASESLFNAARNLAIKRGNKELAQRIWDMQTKNSTNKETE